MVTIKTPEDVKDLLRLAREISRSERVDVREAMRRAIAQLGQLQRDVKQDVKYVPRPVARYRITPAGLQALSS